MPEDEFDLDAMSREIRAMYEENHKRYVLIIVAEGAGSAIEIAKLLEEKTGIDTRASVLGHIQRGGSPTVMDRVYASTLGECATRALLSGVANVVFGIRHGRVVNVNLYDAVNRKKQLDPEYIRMAKVLA